MYARILILEGVTGAGKTSVISELCQLVAPDVEFIPEDDTLGDLMNQIRDPSWCAQPTFAALDSVLARLSEDRLEPGVAPQNGKCFLVERFHFTAFALFPHLGLLPAI